MALEEVVDEDAVQYLAQRRSPGTRSQDSGFSGYSDSSEGSSNNSPVPNAVRTKETPPTSTLTRKLSNPSANRRAADGAERSPLNQVGILETDLDASDERHVSRVYIRSAAATDVDSYLRDVMCEKNIKPVNLSACSAEKSVTDKSLINNVFAQSSPRVTSNQRVDNDNRNDNNNDNNNENNNDVANRSTDSLAPLLEHKSLPKVNSSWKKLGESFRKVLGSSRTSPPLDNSKSAFSCAPNVAIQEPLDNNNRTVIISKMTNKERKATMIVEEENEQHQQITVKQLDIQKRTESPTPTSHYVCGPRSSTPRKTLLTNSRRRRSSHLESVEQPILRVHWADSCATQHMSDLDRSAIDRQPQKAPASRLFNGQQHYQHHYQQQQQQQPWPDNSTWDSDTPSLEIGRENHQPIDYEQPVVDSQKKLRRGLKMGVGEWPNNPTVDYSVPLHRDVSSAKSIGQSSCSALR